MSKSVKSYIYKGNKLNFLFLTFLYLFEATILIIISLMLERIMAIAVSKDMDALLTQGITFIILFVVAIIVYGFAIYIKPKYKKKAIKQYKNNIYNQIINKSISNFNECTTSTYLSILTNDVNYIEENYIFSIFELICNICLFICSIVIMIIYSPMLTLAAILLSMIPLVSSLIVGTKLSFHEKEISDANGGFMHFVKDNLIGFSTIKVFKAEKKIEQLFVKNNDSLETKKERKVRTLTKLEVVQNITTSLAQFGVFFIGAYIAIRYNSIEASVIILFVQLMNYVMSPLLSIPSILSKRLASIPLFKKVDDILKIEDVVADKESIENVNDIEIVDLSFKYDDKVVLDHINFKIENNKAYAVIGASGSGKSTLLNLLVGRNKDYNGEILYNGIELNKLSIDDLFEITSFVEQNVFVFDDTILNNITMYSDVDKSLLEEVINDSGLSELIKEKGEDYRCGENGCNLSGGEKQRISIARALIKKSKILLLDEATSALDNETSITITNNLLKIKDTIKIMITHRIEASVLTCCDQIIVMKNGKIVEVGTYEELINKNSYFKSLSDFSK